jgi:hypothetical protein
MSHALDPRSEYEIGRSGESYLYSKERFPKDLLERTVTALVNKTILSGDPYKREIPEWYQGLLHTILENESESN